MQKSEQEYYQEDEANARAALNALHDPVYLSVKELITKVYRGEKIDRQLTTDEFKYVTANKDHPMYYTLLLMEYNKLKELGFA